MKIKETICTELDARGRVVKRSRTVDVVDFFEDREPANRRERCGFGELHRTSSKRIYEAYEDYRMSNQW